jgi:hypothetical protein
MGSLSIRDKFLAGKTRVRAYLSPHSGMSRRPGRITDVTVTSSKAARNATAQGQHQSTPSYYIAKATSEHIRIANMKHRHAAVLELLFFLLSLACTECFDDIFRVEEPHAISSLEPIGHSSAPHQLIFKSEPLPRTSKGDDDSKRSSHTDTGSSTKSSKSSSDKSDDSKSNR